MNAQRKSRLMYSIVQNYFRDWDKSYWELDWVTIDDFREFADLFHITPKAGATPARTLYERLQKYHFKFYKNIILNKNFKVYNKGWKPTEKEIQESIKEKYNGAFGE